MKALYFIVCQKSFFSDNKSLIFIKKGIGKVSLNKGDLGEFALWNSTSIEFAITRQRFI